MISLPFNEFRLHLDAPDRANSYRLLFYLFNLAAAVVVYFLYGALVDSSILGVWLLAQLVIPILKEAQCLSCSEAESSKRVPISISDRLLDTAVCLTWGCLLCFLCRYGDEFHLGVVAVLTSGLITAYTFLLCISSRFYLVPNALILLPSVLGMLIRGGEFAYFAALAVLSSTLILTRAVCVMSTMYRSAVATSDQNLLLANELAELSGSVQKKNVEIRTLNQRLHWEIERVEKHKENIKKEKEKVEALSLELEIESRTDALTGITNRRGFDESTKREWSRSLRTQSPLALILCDVDLFKRFNDDYGHQAGDECLIKVAKCLSKAGNRATDVVARYGGEEFAILLPDTPVEAAAYIADRARGMLEDHRIGHSSSPFKIVTASFGVASSSATADCDISELISAADKALYTAKSQGRNKVEIAPFEPFK